MLVSHFLDLVPIWVLLISTILLMTIFIEFGFRLGKRSQLNAKKAQTSQVRAIMGAGLGLLAFMLASIKHVEVQPNGYVGYVWYKGAHGVRGTRGVRLVRGDRGARGHCANIAGFRPAHRAKTNTN